MSAPRRVVAGLFAALFLALHLPFLPASLEDLDSINFALGVRAFDVSHHQPHPPGYPIYVLIAKAARLAVGSEATALSLVGVVAGALAAFALVELFRRMKGGAQAAQFSLLSTALTMTAPLYWFTAARPLSDVPGLAAALGIQAATLAASTSTGIVVASFLAGLAAGIRSQVGWLTVPLIVLVVMRQSAGRRLAAARALGAFIVGGLLWGLPLVWLTGGPGAYWRALFNQGAEDLSGVAMVWTTPTARQLALAAYSAFVAPWASVPVAAVVLVAAVAGCIVLWLRDRPALLTVAAAFGPYLLFDVLFQETATTRYALPLVVPTAFLAASAFERLPRGVAATATILLSLAMAGLAGRALSGYSRFDAPAFRLLANMTAAERAKRSEEPPVLAMHRREDFDLRRPIVWMGDMMPTFQARLAAPPKHEWMELVKYWKAGGDGPVWFVADPLRSDLALVDHGEPEVSYRWPFEARDLVGGIRPNEMDWYVIEPPEWYLEDGWALTPETAGVAREDGRGPSHGPITGWIRRQPAPMTLMIGGRNLSAEGPSGTLRVSIDGRAIEDITVAPGFFLKMLRLPPGSLFGPGRYAPITVAAADSAERPRADLAIEQFDAKPEGRIVYGYGEGWLEQEYNPATGAHWRWTGDRATIHLRSERRSLLLTCTGGTETFRKPSHIIVRAGGQLLDEYDVGETFTVSVGIPSALLDTGETSVTIETNQTYVPAERRFRSRDRRHLGLKISDCRVTLPS